MAIIDSVKLPDNSTYDLTDNYSGYQKETLATPLNINGDTKTTVEGALDGINAYVDDTVEAAFDVYGAKNLFPYPYDNTTKTENGITFTDNGDGTVTVGDVSSQTATGNAFFYEIQTKIVKIPAGTYKITGCPSGGNINTYYLRVVAYDVSTGTQVTYSDDYGSGATITISNGIRINAVITVKSGTTIAAGGITFSPMIRNNLVKDETFTTGAKTNLQLTQDKAERTDLTTIFATGNKNTTGAQIAAGKFFYLNGVYCKAKTNIAANATFTSGTNYEVSDVGKVIEPIPLFGYGAERSFNATVKNEIEISFTNASNYSLFSGSTSGGTEGGWYGYKHSDSKYCHLIFFDRSGVYAITRAADGTYTKNVIFENN